MTIEQTAEKLAEQIIKMNLENFSEGKTPYERAVETLQTLLPKAETNLQVPTTNPSHHVKTPVNTETEGASHE